MNLDPRTDRSDSAHIEKRLDEILDELHKINSAFPVDDAGRVDHEGHRKYHESLIRAAEAQETFWRELRLDIAKKGIWGILIIVVGLVVTGLAAKFGFSHRPY